MMMLTLLVACAARDPLTVFPAAAPIAVAPEPVEFAPAADECHTVVPLVPGRPAPYVVDGAPTCRAQVVPESYLVELLEAQSRGAWWETRLRVCEEGRGNDRQHAQALVTRLQDERDVHRKDAQVARWVAPAGIGAALVVGFLLGGMLP